MSSRKQAIKRSTRTSGTRERAERKLCLRLIYGSSPHTHALHDANTLASAPTHFCSHTLLLLFRFPHAFAGYIKNNNKEPVVKKSATKQYITPFNPNERDLKKHSTENWDKYSDPYFTRMRN